MAHPFFDRFDRALIINLRHRGDRRDEIADELGRLGTRVGEQNIAMFEAYEPDDRGDFPSIGARGCFMSHLGVLRQAHLEGVESLLILEDDVHFGSAFVAHQENVLEALDTAPWQIFYGGGEPMEPVTKIGPVTEVVPGKAIRLSHALGIKRAVLPHIIQYFEAMLARPAGSPDGGPMHVDGAYSWFRKDFPDFTTVIATPQIVTQRSSRSDITGNWKDRLPFANQLRRLRNKLS